MAELFRLWLQEPMTRIFPDSAGRNNSAEKSRPFHLSAARGETECFQIGVRTEGISPNYLNAELIELKGPGDAEISRDNIDFLYPEYVPVKWPAGGQSPEDVERIPPAFFPDPLMPDWQLNTAGPVGPPTRSVWVRIRVPRDAKPGVYRGKVSVRIGRRNFKAENQAKAILFEKTKSITFRFKVWGFTIPERTGLLNTNWIFLDPLSSWCGHKLWSPPFWKMIERVADDMAAHRQNVILTPFFGGAYIGIEQPGDQLVPVQRSGRKYTFDFKNLDRWISLFLRRNFELIEGQHVAGGSRVPLSFWQSSSGKNGKSVKKVEFLDASDPRFENFLTQFFKALWRHLERKGWSERLVQHISDEPQMTELPRYRRLADIVRKAAPGIKLLDALTDPELADLADYPVPLENEYDRVVKNAHVPPEDIWVYYCCGPTGRWPNRFVEYLLIRVRIITWICFQKRIPGFLHWGYNWWGGGRKTRHNPWDDATDHRHPGGDSYMVYPPRDNRMSTDEIVDSIRWEIFREGLEDYEYLTLTRELADSGNSAAKRILQDVEEKIVPGWTDHTRDWRLLNDIRMRMGELLSKEQKG